MKDFWILKILDFFSFFYRVIGIDYEVMRKVLQIKLLMDQRRVPAVLMNYKNKREDNTFNKSLIFYGIIGIFFAFIIMLPIPLFFKMNFFNGMLIFMIAMTMVSDFSSILLDTKDKGILLSKPIKPQTVNAAKMTHILINLLTITFVMAGASLIVGLIKYGFLFFGILFFQLFLISGLVLFLTSVFYFFMLIIFDGDKLKDMINYFQIILSFVMMVGYQFTGHIFKFMDHNVVLVFKWWMYLIPSAWFAAPFSLIFENRLENHFIHLSFLGVVVPIFLLIIYFRVITRYFEKNLHKLDRITTKKRKSMEIRTVTYKKLISLIVPNKLENIFCRFSQSMISSERSLKLRLYPSLGFATFFPIIMLANSFMGNDSLTQALTEIPKGSYYLIIYGTIGMLSLNVLTINSSENYKGAWIYKVLPIEFPGVILMGALKGLILKYLIPVYLFVSILFAIPYGARLIPHLILIFANMLLLIILIFRLSLNELPFGKEFQNGENSNLGVFIGSLAFCAISAALHYAVKDVGVGLLLYIVVVFFVSAVLWKTSAEITWQDV